AGAASGGLLGMLLGSKRGRGMGGTALKVGSVAALGAAALKAYTYWQSQQAQQNGHRSALNQASPTVPSPISQETEEHSQALLKAMIAAAKSDGHIDERERSLMHAELDRLNADPKLRIWMEDELRRPLDPAEVARAATTPALAAEMYLASLLIADDTAFMERAYLDELARQLQLAPGLKSELEAQARAV
ncbi:MAG: tellurite resistance TerB family protein, partial [Deltaproteobacteria bacterium]|nr:tellurite resistance TerB family protein [Deltaproteobacteria bacterium]